MRSGSAASVEGGGNSHHAQAILSKGPSESTLTTTESAGGGNSSQTPSCRALAGSLASFDTSSIVNTEGNYCSSYRGIARGGAVGVNRNQKYEIRVGRVS